MFYESIHKTYKMSISNILGTIGGITQIVQDDITVGNLTVEKDMSIAGDVVYNGGLTVVGTVPANELVLSTGGAGYVNGSTALNYTNNAYSLGSVVGQDTSVGPAGVQYSKIEVHPQINASLPEVLFVGRDRNVNTATNAVSTIGTFTRSITQAGFTADARLGLTNNEPDASPAVVDGVQYYFSLPNDPSVDANNVLSMVAKDTSNATSTNTLMKITPSGAKPYSAYDTTFITSKLGVARLNTPSTIGEVFDSVNNTPVKAPISATIPINELIDVEDTAPTVLKTVILPASAQNASYYQIRVRGGSLQYTQADLTSDNFVLYWCNQADGSGVDGTETYWSLSNFNNSSTITFTDTLPVGGPAGALLTTNEMLFNYYPQTPTSSLFWILSNTSGYPSAGNGAMTALTAINITITPIF